MSDSTARASSDKEWNDLMHRLRQQSKARPQPFFYARVRARLLTPARPAYWLLPAWLRLPAYAAMLGALVLAVSGDGAATARGNYHFAHLVQHPPR